MSSRHCISPLDGRYAASTGLVAAHFSEFALMRARIHVELTHVRALDEIRLFAPLTSDNLQQMARLEADFAESDYLAIKAIEGKVRHDVKACELYLRGALTLANPNQIHFGLTSEDVNNLAYAINMREYVKQVQLPLWHQQLSELLQIAQRWRAAPFPARTHGQHASPTTAGKEIAVYLTRLLRSYAELRTTRFRGKLNGATGNHSAFCAAAPQVDWIAYEHKLVASLGFEPNAATTQIEDHGSLIRYFDIVRTHNNTAIDLCQDMWMYTSYGYLVQRAQADEVGSSTMPHKINPIRFENAEGNLQLSSALLVFLADKLSRSRMQRDLSESTVMRNIGVAIGHHHLGLTELDNGLKRIELDSDACTRELDAHVELLSEPMQTALRLTRSDDVYTELKLQSRGKAFGREQLLTLAEQLPPAARTAIAQLLPSAYLGNAVQLVDLAVANAQIELAR
jgi:adenylosuccinate lyase